MAPAAGESRENRPARPAGFTAADLAADLRGLGVRAGEALIVHSSMKSIARRMQRIGLCDVQTHDFPVSAWEPGFSRFQALVDGRWEEIPSAPARGGGRAVGRLRPVVGRLPPLDERRISGTGGRRYAVYAR
jgi:hypothetical protein